MAQRAPIKNRALLESYHDTLCFARAYPDSEQLVDHVEKELGAFGERISRYAGSSVAKLREFEDSGIVNTSVSNAFSYEMAHYLCERYPDDTDIDWHAIEDGGIDTISGILGQLVSWQENDTLDNDESLETQDWLSWGTTRKLRTSLQVLLALVRNHTLPYAVQKHLYESAEIPVRWNLRDSKACRTRLRAHARVSFYQMEPLVGRTHDLRQFLQMAAPPLRRLPEKEGARYVCLIREVLASRVRELYPLTNANQGEVYLVEPGRGLQIAIFGTVPRVRLPLESNFGALLVRNGMPVGYGVAAVLFDNVEIAINIFPAFRSGESSFAIEQFFRIFHAHFGATQFLVRSYQVGDDNDEALESGSFWFYYKLGFRPVRKEVRALAEREAARIATNPYYRSSRRILKQLAKSDVFFHINPEHMTPSADVSIISLGAIVTRISAYRFGGDRSRMEDVSKQELLHKLDHPHTKRWHADELVALNRLAPLFNAIPGLAKWPQSERRAITEIIRAKGSENEKRYVSLSQRHTLLRKALLAMTHRPADR